jgi:hypothetical protein
MLQFRIDERSVKLTVEGESTEAPFQLDTIPGSIFTSAQELKSPPEPNGSMEKP